MNSSASNCDINNKISELDSIIASATAESPTLAQALLERGKLYWKLGQRGRAISDYTAAAAIDPDPNGQAAQALRLSNDIMDFYNTDLYNP